MLEVWWYDRNVKTGPSKHKQYVHLVLRIKDLYKFTTHTESNRRSVWVGDFERPWIINLGKLEVALQSFDGS